MLMFEKIRWKNLMSYGNAWTEIDLTAKAMTLISGRNGSGKSVLLEAVSMGLFGIPYRNINKPNLVNSINGKDCVVEIEFSVGRRKYKVIRGIKPAIFEIWCDGKMIDQDSTSKDYQKYFEQNILKMNYKSFTQLVVLGSSDFIPFMKLTAAERRSVIEELLDIQVFSAMNVVLKEKQSSAKETMRDLDRGCQSITEKIAIQEKHIANLKSKQSNTKDRYLAEIANSEAQIKTLDAGIAVWESQIEDKRNSIRDSDAVEDTIRKCEQYRDKSEATLNKNQKSQEFYTTNNTCPVCTQNIDADFREKMIQEKHQKCNEILEVQQKINDKLKVAMARRQEIREVCNAITLLHSKVQQDSAKKQALTSYIATLRRDIENLGTAAYSTDAEERTLLDFRKELLDKVAEREKTVEMQATYGTAAELLKDAGIKARIIRQYLPVINKAINKYLTAMDAYFNFNLDENFKEVIKSRYRDEFQYESFSGGQRFRIDMALLLTWREISRKKNSTNCNLLILDEVFDGSLDLDGVQEFMKLLRILSKKIHIFAISHKADMISDRFDRHLKVDIKNNFSTIKE